MTLLQIQHDSLGSDCFLLRLKTLSQQMYYYSLLLVNLRVHIMKTTHMCTRPEPMRVNPDKVTTAQPRATETRCIQKTTGLPK